MTKNPPKPIIKRAYMRRMTQGEITRYWHVIRANIKIAFGDVDDLVLSSFMAEVRDERIQVWVVMGRSERLALLGMVTTRIINDRRFGRKALYIETLSAYGRLTQSVWETCLEALEAYARDNGCAIIDADVRNEAVVKMAGRLGFVPVTTRIRKEL